MRRTVKVCVVVALGLLVTLFSGLYKQDFSGPSRIDLRYGLPLGWHGEHGPVYLNSPPPTSWYSWDNFMYDAAAWCALFGILALILRKRT